MFKLNFTLSSVATLRSSAAFALSSLFKDGETGVIFDPSVAGTLYQTTAMQIPARVGDPVGMMLDQSQWGDTALSDLYGPELVTNGFTLHTSRTAKTGTSNGSLNYTDGVLTINRGTTDAMAWPVDVVAGAKPYLMTFTVAGGAIYSSFSEYRGVGTYTFIVPSTQEPVIWPANPSTTAVIKDISIREVTVASYLDPIMGPELVTNGGFDTGIAGWESRNSAVVSAVSGKLRVAGNGASAYPFAVLGIQTVIGKTYRWSALISRVSGATNSGYLEKSDSSATFSSNNVKSTSISEGPASVTFTATATTSYLRLLGTGANDVYDFDNVSLREIPGHHATQATAAKRPTYGIHPKGGVRNLLTYTEDFSNGVWTKQNLTVAGKTLTPTATNTSHNLIYSASGLNGGGIYTASGRASAAGYDYLLIRIDNGAGDGVKVSFNIATGAVSNAAAPAGTGWTMLGAGITPSPDGGFDFYISFTLSASATGIRLIPYVSNVAADAFAAPAFLGDGASGIILHETQLETGSTATAYQKVVSKYEVAEAGVPSVHYLSFDGVDDKIVANTTNPATTDMTYAIAYDSPATGGGASLMWTSPATDSVAFGGTFDTRYDGNWQFIGAKPSPNVPHVLLMKGKNGLHQTYADEVLLHSSTPATTSKARSEINLFGNSIAGKLYGFVAVQKFSDEDEDQSINKILRSRMGIADKTGETP